MKQCERCKQIDILLVDSSAIMFASDKELPELEHEIEQELTKVNKLYPDCQCVYDDTDTRPEPF